MEILTSPTALREDSCHTVFVLLRQGAVLDEWCSGFSIIADMGYVSTLAFWGILHVEQLLTGALEKLLH